MSCQHVKTPFFVYCVVRTMPNIDTLNEHQTFMLIFVCVSILSYQKTICGNASSAPNQFSAQRAMNKFVLLLCYCLCAISLSTISQNAFLSICRSMMFKAGARRGSRDLYIHHKEKENKLYFIAFWIYTLNTLYKPEWIKRIIYDWMRMYIIW